jgi:ATP-dependent RNA helicase RhlE
MVATDVAARGLDIDDLPLVVNYEMPYVPEDYIHRIGRTGRAGAAGEAVSFCAPDEERLLTEIERLLKRSIPVAPPVNLAAPQRSPRVAHAARPPQPAQERAPRHMSRAATHQEMPDRNPDQAPRTRAAPRREPPAALTANASIPGRHWHKKPAPVPALLMKRRVSEPENA